MPDEKNSVKAFVLINVRAGMSPQVVSKARRIPYVTSAHACWGRPDVLVAVEAPDEKALSDAILRKLQLIEGVESTDTHLIIE